MAHGLSESNSTRSSPRPIPLLEVIIQDDGSTDDTVAICNEYAARFPYIKVRRNEHNLGFNLNFKSAAMRAQSDFVAISDQDDVWMADKIETLVAHIGDHDICFSTHLRAGRPRTAIRSPRSIVWRPCSLAVLRATPCCSAATSSRPRSTG